MAQPSSRRVPIWAIILAVVVGAVAVGAVAWLVVSDRRDKAPALDARAVARGQAVYQANCASCHGPKGEGAPNWQSQNADGTLPPPPHDSTGHTWHHGDGFLYRYVREGGKAFETVAGFKSAMPAFGDRLTEAQVVDVLTYLKSRWGTREREFQDAVSKADPLP
jgi:mono/diheme cytochrome c family protein